MSRTRDDPDPDAINGFVEYIRNHPDKSDSTATRYRSTLRRWVDFCDEEGANLTDPDVTAVEDFLTVFMGDYPETTVQTTRGALSSFLKRQHRDREQTAVDQADVGSWSAETQKSNQPRSDEIHTLDDEEVDKLIEHSPSPEQRNRLLLRLLLQTGIRSSELSTIQVGDDPDWDENDLGDIDREHRQIQIIDHKNDTTRTVFYAESLDLPLRLWITSDRSAVYGASQSPYLFPTQRSEKISPYQVNDIVAGAAESAGIQEEYMDYADERWDHETRSRRAVTAHTLRHTFATKALESGMNVAHLRDILGHESVETTIEQYVHTDTDALRDAYRTTNLGF